MRPVILIVIVVIVGHFSKCVVNPGLGTQIKGVDTLPAWLVEASHRTVDPGEGTSNEMLYHTNTAPPLGST